VTEDEYYASFESLGFKRTGGQTVLVEEWERADGAAIYVTRASELSPSDRARKVDYLKRTLGVGFPFGGGGVH
jgi:hypothetical protein